MSEKQDVPASGAKPTITELTERIQEQSVADQPGGILEPSSISSGKSSQQSDQKSGKQSKQGGSKSSKQSQQASDKPAKKPQAKKKIEGAALIGIDVAKDADFSEWYQQVLTKGDFLDYYDVSGCYILKPPSYFIWEEIQGFFNQKIKGIDVENCAFPLFVSEEVLQKEKAHIEGFAAEVAWVTHAGKSPLEKRVAIRPTSETVMYPYYAKWIRSHRDLPLKLNQWNSVVRWEFKHPVPFLRTREFHWQEGHTAHLTLEESTKEVRQILDWYASVYTELLAVPVVRGQKTENEKFAGAKFTETIEGYIATTGRGIQAGTSHCLGQNFSKMFGITVEDPSSKEGEKKPPLNVYQNSWGLSTRTIGVMVMTHGDDRGLVVPPRVARKQVVIVPVGITAKSTEEDRMGLYKEIEALEEILKAADLRVVSDMREGYSPGWKFNDWEMRGVPLRLEFGPRDSAAHRVTTSRRDIQGDEGKGTIPITELGTGVQHLLENIQKDLYNRANDSFKSHTKHITNWDDFVPALNSKNVCLIPHCLTEKCEDEIKELSARKEDDDAPQDERAPSMGAKSLCIPFDQPKEGLVKGETKCTNPNCTNKAEKWCLFGRSY